jgi:hypothetical protein
MWEMKMFGASQAFDAWLKSFGPVPPAVVPISYAQQILGNKSRSQIYEAVGRGDLVALKDKRKTLISVQSLVEYIAKLEPAKIKTVSRWPSRASPTGPEAQK